MAGELRHRGPDGTGLYLDGRFGMFNTRLAIIDLTGGDQPLSDEDRPLLGDAERRDLQLRRAPAGARARSAIASRPRPTPRSSPTRTRSGASTACARLNGDFAFAVWDRREQELFLARDRFGVRPLFLAEFGGDLCFASEAKALLRHPAARRELDPLGLVEAFTTWSILPDRSAFVGVRELAPAHYLRVRARTA